MLLVTAKQNILSLLTRKGHKPFIKASFTSSQRCSITKPSKNLVISLTYFKFPRRNNMPFRLCFTSYHGYSLSTTEATANLCSVLTIKPKLHNQYWLNLKAKCVTFHFSILFIMYFYYVDILKSKLAFSSPAAIKYTVLKSSLEYEKSFLWVVWFWVCLVWLAVLFFLNFYKTDKQNEKLYAS